MPVHFIGRNNHARPCFFDFAANRWVKVDKNYLVLGYFHSSRSSLGKTSGISSWSSRFLCIELKDSSQPILGSATGLSTMQSSSITISTESVIWYCSSTDLLSRIPFELPMRITGIFILIVLL